MTGTVGRKHFRRKLYIVEQRIYAVKSDEIIH